MKEKPLPTEININQDAKNGQDKCPKCGATDIKLNIVKGVLICNCCKHEFANEKINDNNESLFNLTNEVFTTGSKDISDSNNLVTLKCQSCGAEVVIDTNTSTQNKCHWCRNMLSINEQIPNGAVPDMVLPFKIEKQDAGKQIAHFVSKRNFFANKMFKNEFETGNIMGVYLPYLVVDVNSHAIFSGHAEHETNSYLVGRERQRKVYDADEYKIFREYDIVIKGLTIESNSDKLDHLSNEKTNNVINAIMPFDIENCVKFKSNYLNGFTSEKRNINIENVKDLVNKQVKDIARFRSNDSLRLYDRGVRFDKEDVNIIGSQWKTAYLPVWLYSYQEIKGSKKVLHYVAVNARTSETMGSIPIDIPKLLMYTILIEFISVIFMFLIQFDYNFIFLFSGVSFYMVNYYRYRNSGERHRHEVETDTEIKNMKKEDVFIRKLHRLENSKMRNANNFRVEGSKIKSGIYEKY